MHKGAACEAQADAASLRASACFCSREELKDVQFSGCCNWCASILGRSRATAL